MKIHHVTCEWDYTLYVEEIGGYHYLTLSILRQPDRTPFREIDGVQVLLWATVGIARRAVWGPVEEVWLRGTMSVRGVASIARLRFKTRRDADEQLVRVYNVLRHYERELLQ